MPRYRPKPAKRKHKAKRNKLPIFLGLGGIFFLLVATYFALQRRSYSYIPEVTNGPSLQGDKQKVDLGDVKLGNTAQVLFKIKNVGDQPLLFSEAPYIEVKEGC